MRRIKNRVARSETGSADGRRVFDRELRVSGLRRGSFESKGGREEMFEIGTAFGRGCNWSRDISRRLSLMHDESLCSNVLWSALHRVN